MERPSSGELSNVCDICAALTTLVGAGQQERSRRGQMRGNCSSTEPSEEPLRVQRAWMPATEAVGSSRT